MLTDSSCFLEESFPDFTVPSYIIETRPPMQKCDDSYVYSMYSDLMASGDNDPKNRFSFEDELEFLMNPAETVYLPRQFFGSDSITSLFQVSHERFIRITILFTMR